MILCPFCRRNPAPYPGGACKQCRERGLLADFERERVRDFALKQKRGHCVSDAARFDGGKELT